MDEESRELILDLQRQLDRERSLRVEAEALLGAVEQIAAARDEESVIRKLVGVLEPLVGCETAVALQRCGPDLVPFGRTGPAIRIGPMFERVLAGQATLVYDLGSVEEWAPAAPSWPDARSALVVPMGGGWGVLLCVHSSRAFFNRRHRRLVERIAPLGDHSVSTIEALRLRMDRASRIDLLERAMSAVRLGLVLEQHGRVVFANEAARRIAAPWPGVDAWWAAARRAHDPETRRVELRTPFDERVVLERTAVGTVPWVRGEAEIALVDDVTRWVVAERDLREARDQAMAANRAKSAFLATMSHELRTPLNAIIGYTELLVELAEERGDEESAVHLERIGVAATHLLSMIRNVLDLARVEAGRISLKPERIGVASLFRDLEATIGPVAAARGNRLELQPDPQALEITADRESLTQVLINLLANACKFTDHGSIQLRTEVLRPESVVFRISDTGVGIPEDQLDRIFLPFVQVDGSSTRRHEGSGLGLAICKQLCEAMGGAVAVQSTYGRGSTFLVTLPQPGARAEP